MHVHTYLTELALAAEPSKLGKAQQGKAQLGKARQGKAQLGKARQGKARQGSPASSPKAACDLRGSG